MDAGLFDVLHDAADDYPLSVGEGVHVDLDGVFQVVVDQDWMLHRGLDRLGDVGVEALLVVDNLHGPAAQHIGRADHPGVGDRSRHGHGLRNGPRGAAGRLLEAYLFQQRLEPLAVLGAIDRIRRRARAGDAAALQGQAQRGRGLPAELHHNTEQLTRPAFRVHDRQDVFLGERLEIEPVGGIVVGAHRLRVAVDHDGLIAQVPQGQRRVHAAVVELDALTDPVRAPAEDHHLLPGLRLALAFRFVGGREIGRQRWEFSGARVHPLEDRRHALCDPKPADLPFRDLEQLAEPVVREAQLLGLAESWGRQRVFPARELLLDRQDVLHLVEEPAIEPRQLVDFVYGDPHAQPIGHMPQPLRVGTPQALADLRDDLVRIAFRQRGMRLEPIAVHFQRADGLLQGFLERAPDGHDLPHRLHLRGQNGIGLRELLEREPRDLHHDIVDARLEGGHRHARDVVGDLVQGVADGEFGRDLRDGEPRRLRRQGGAAGDPWVHLDDDQVAVHRIDRELDVGAARVHADLAHDHERGVAHALVLLVREGLRGRDGDAVAGVDPHRVEVLDGADDHDVVLRVAHDLELEFLPADDRALHQDLPDGARAEPPVHVPFELLPVVGDVAARPAEGEGRANDDGETADLLDHIRGVDAVPDDDAIRRPQSDLHHGMLERLAVLSLADRLVARADELHAVLLQDALLVQTDGGVERGLPAHCGQERVRPLALDHLLDHVERDRLVVGAVRQLRIGPGCGRDMFDYDDGLTLP